jgi:hypothetical protein
MKPALRSSLKIRVRMWGWRVKARTNGALREPGHNTALVTFFLAHNAAMSKIG